MYPASGRDGRRERSVEGVSGLPEGPPLGFYIMNHTSRVMIHSWRACARAGLRGLRVACIARPAPPPPFRTIKIYISIHIFIDSHPHINIIHYYINDHPEGVWSTLHRRYRDGGPFFSWIVSSPWPGFYAILLDVARYLSSTCSKYTGDDVNIHYKVLFYTLTLIFTHTALGTRRHATRRLFAARSHMPCILLTN